MYSVPVLMFLYPLAIALIVLTLFSSQFHHSKIIYQCTIFFTMIAALVDGLKASPEFISSTSFSQTLINFSQKYLPLSDIGMGWVVLSLIGFIIGFIIYKIKHRKIPQA
ncbi:branched-chain amino acid transport system II carrier protein [Staphylococcus aureus]|nr:branched-chain amino acid transport system II carrier protein [Staphylococcus aureus]